jgi:hypothetical protein
LKKATKCCIYIKKEESRLIGTFRVPFSTTNRPAAEVAPPARKLECWNAPFFFCVSVGGAMLHKEQTFSRLIGILLVNIYLTSIQGPRCAKNKDPLCIPWPARRVKDLTALLVQEPAILDDDFVVLSFLLEKKRACGILAILYLRRVVDKIELLL